jgi:glycosyltransferase involved in cell wall biosynthesis
LRIIFFSHYFPPEVNAPANRTHEHCREWVRTGHEVHVVTCVPSHPLGRPFPGFKRRWYQHERVDGIHVHRVWTYLAPNRGVFRRTLNYLSFVPMAVLRALKLGRFDIAIGTSPQFFCAAATGVFGWISATPWVFELRDLWPESIAAVGAMRRSLALRLIERFELRLYREAAAVVCVTESFIRALTARGIPEAKLHFVPNGIDPDFWRSTAGPEERRAMGVQANQLLACYVGTIGLAHGLGTVLQAAAILRDSEPNIRVVIVGDGAELSTLKDLAAEQRLTNVTFTGLVPRKRVPGILSAADLALVTLKPTPVFKTVLPSKMFEAMAAGVPILLAVDGEARATLERAAAGLYVPPSDAGALAEAMKRLARDRAVRAAMGRSGVEFVAREFNRRSWAERYASVLSGVAQRTAALGPVDAPVQLND